jgi:hypothetical protein
MANSTPPNQAQKDALGQVELVHAADGQVTLDVRLEADTVWLSQAQLAELFDRERSVISKHIGNVFKEGELAPFEPVQNLHRFKRRAPGSFIARWISITCM